MSAPSRRIAAALLLVGAVLGFGGIAAAHATLVGSTPANNETVGEVPREVVLEFDQPVRAPGDSAVTVLDPTGRDVADGASDVRSGGTEVVQPVGDGPEGTYTVSYVLLSDDGHVISGSWVFHVGRMTSEGAADSGEDPVVRVVGVLGRTLALAGAILAAGVAALAALVDRRRASWRLLGAGAAVACLGGVLAMLALAAELSGGGLADAPSAMGDLVDSTGLLRGWVPRIVAAAVVAVVAVVGSRVPRAVDAAAVLSVGLLVLPAFGGHASVVSPVAVAADAVHLLGAAVWVGGLAALVLTWDASRDRLARFSALALWAAVIVVVSGAAGTWFQAGSLDAVRELTSTPWGVTLVVKLVGVGGILFMGWVHRRWLADAALAVATMVRSLRIEVVLAVAVLAVTAVLVNIPPPRAAEVEPVEAVRQAGSTTVRMQVTPARSGTNAVHLDFLAIDGSLTPVDAVELRISSADVAPRKVGLTMNTPSQATATGVNLTPGSWRFEVTLVTGGATDSTTFEVPIP